MKIIEDKEKLERLDKLIQMEATGSPSVLATRLGISKSSLYRILNLLKTLGCPIYFCHSRNSYCYKQAGKLTIEFQRFESRKR